MELRSSWTQAFFASRKSASAVTRSSESSNDSTPSEPLRVFLTIDLGSASTASQPFLSQFLMTTEGSGHSTSLGRPTLKTKSPGLESLPDSAPSW